MTINVSNNYKGHESVNIISKNYKHEAGAKQYALCIEIPEKLTTHSKEVGGNSICEILQGLKQTSSDVPSYALILKRKVRTNSVWVGKL